jgi:hypothetical protein
MHHMLFLTLMFSLLGVITTLVDAQTPQIDTRTGEFEHIRGGFSGISDLFVSPSGLVYVTDARSHYVYRINTETGQVDSLGGRGFGSTQFNTPVGIHATNDMRIYVHDGGNARIQVFDRRFQPMGQIAFPSGSSSLRPGSGIHLTRDGQLVFWDGGAGRLVSIRENYETDALYRPDVSGLGQEITALRSGNGMYMIIDQSGTRVFRYQDNGRYVGFWQWPEVISDLRSAEKGYLMLTRSEFIFLSEAWQPMWRMGHGADTARLVFLRGPWLYMATERDVYRMPV